MGTSIRDSQGGVDDVVRIARTELRRTVRKLLGSWTKLALFGISALFFLGPVLLFGTIGLSILGEEIATGTYDLPGETTVTDIVTGGSAIVLCLFLFIGTMRATTNAVVLDEPDSLLLSTSLPAIVGGLVLAEFLLFGLWILPPTVVLSAAFAYGAGTVVPMVVGPVVVTGLLAVAVSIGFLFGLCIRHLVTVYEPIAAYRTPLAVVAGLGYVSLFAFEMTGAVMESLYWILGDSPAGWPGYLLLVGVPGVSTNLLGIAGAVLSTILVLGGAFYAASWVGAYHWFAEPARTEESTTTERVSTGYLERALSNVVSRPVRVVAVTTLLRTKRAPIRLLYVAYPLFGAIYVVQDILQSGTVPSYVAVMLCLYVVWGAGALFTLNPLGDLGSALPAVLTSTASGRDIVLGLTLAGALLATPIALLISVGSGLVSPLSFEATAILVGVTAVGAIGSPALATGIGTLFPRFGAVRVGSNRKAVMPSKTAFLIYSFVVVLSAVGLTLAVTTPLADLAGGFLSWLLSGIPGISVSVPPAVVTVFATLVVALSLLVSALSAGIAARYIDSYRPP